MAELEARVRVKGGALVVDGSTVLANAIMLQQRAILHSLANHEKSAKRKQQTHSLTLVLIAFAAAVAAVTVFNGATIHAMVFGNTDAITVEKSVRVLKQEEPRIELTANEDAVRRMWDATMFGGALSNPAYAADIKAMCHWNVSSLPGNQALLLDGDSRAVVFRELLSDAECDYLVALAKRAPAMPGSRLTQNFTDKKYFMTHVDYTEDAVVAKLERRIAAITGIPAHKKESRLQLTCQGASSLATAVVLHHDLNNAPARIATLIIYLTGRLLTYGSAEFTQHACAH